VPDSLDVPFGGTLTDVEPVPDLPVGHALTDERCDLALSGGQHGCVGVRPGGEPEMRAALGDDRPDLPDVRQM
jgi:hypothetical protein